ncbi:MAG TPA: MFS transporter [Bacteriovoracaceae bacterium]|nr:MFS transporter [Bacteriovoracaceae bacterium]
MFDRKVWPALILASLGYFVDIYDLILFSIVRVPSLRDLGLSGDALMNDGLLLLNLQMAGMLIGGIFFGILGDRRGRLSVLFFSILLYSVANFLNGFVESVTSYAVLRFLAGIGLAGELGAGITLVSELLPKEKRGYGTTIIASVGVSGALLAWVVAENLNWRYAYFIGGGMGMALLFLRIGVLESTMFDKIKSHSSVQRGNFLQLFKSKERILKFVACIAVGAPLWYVIGLLITLSPEFAKVLEVQGEIEAGRAVFYSYAGLIFGDIASGLISQWLQSRKKSVLIFLLSTLVTNALYFFLRGLTVGQFYTLCFAMGIAVGYWAMFVTISAEQFGTNLRATVATSTPNFVRGSVVLITALFAFLKGYISMWASGLTVGVIVMLISFWGYWNIQETFHKDLDFLEE